MNINSINFVNKVKNWFIPSNTNSIKAEQRVEQKDSTFFSTEIDARIKEFKEKCDLEGYAKFLNSKKFPDPEIRARYVADYFDFLQGQAKEKLGSKIFLITEETINGENKNFSKKNPEAFYSLYDTISKYKQLDELSLQNSKKTVADSKSGYPQQVILLKLKGKNGDFSQTSSRTIRLSEKLFNQCPIGSTFEHEIGHLKDCNQNGSHQAYSYLDILEPEEKNLYLKFEKNFRGNYEKIKEELPDFVKRVTNINMFTFPGGYDNKNRTLVSIERARLNLFLNKKWSERFTPELFEKIDKILKKLGDFSSSIASQIDEDPYYRSTPKETKAQAWAVRASGKPVRQDYLLPITEELEEQLAKLGMPKPATYTILPKNYLAERARNLGIDISHIKFGEALVKRLSPELLSKIKR